MTMAPIIPTMMSQPPRCILCRPIDAFEVGAVFAVFLVAGDFGTQPACANDNECDDEGDHSASDEE